MRRPGQIRRRLRSEDGIALPVAMLATAIGLGFASVVILSSVSAQSGNRHDQASEVALVAAEAGANIAIQRQSEVLPLAEKPCVVESELASGTLVVEETNNPADSDWCREVRLTSETEPQAPAGTTISYEVKPEYGEPGTEADDTIKVVATGSTYTGGREVLRRIMVEADSDPEAGFTPPEDEEEPPEEEEEPEEEPEQKNPFDYGQIAGIEWLRLVGHSQVYNGGAASNGAVEIIDSSKVCGGLRIGPETLPPVGRWEQVEWVRPESMQPYSNGTGGGVCFGEDYTEGVVDYPPTVAPDDIATNNSNWRLAGADPVCCNIWQRGNVEWNPGNRSLRLKYGELRLEGDKPYFLCSLHVGNGSILRSSTTKPIRIFFDEPESSKCPGLNGGKQFTLDGGSSITADGAGGPGFYLLGSPKGGPVSKVYFGNGAASAEIVIYAPRSSVEIKGDPKVRGAVIGRTVLIEGGSHINPNGEYEPPPPGDFIGEEPFDPDPEPEEEPEPEPEPEPTVTQTPFERGAFVECTAARPGMGDDPDAGC